MASTRTGVVLAAATFLSHQRLQPLDAKRRGVFHADHKPEYAVHEGRRYRLKFRNASDDIHPLHLHRHSFELVRVRGKQTAGIIKDVVMVGGYQEVEFDCVPAPYAKRL